MSTVQVSNCILCGEQFSFFTRQRSLQCADCDKAVCGKCGVECSSCTGDNLTTY